MIEVRKEIEERPFACPLSSSSIIGARFFRSATITSFHDAFSMMNLFAFYSPKTPCFYLLIKLNTIHIMICFSNRFIHNSRRKCREDTFLDKKSHVSIAYFSINTWCNVNKCSCRVHWTPIMTFVHNRTLSRLDALSRYQPRHRLSRN